MKKKLHCTFIVLLTVSGLMAQKKVVLERLLCYSAQSRLENYWALTELKPAFASQLNTTLQKYFNASLTDSSLLKLKIIGPENTPKLSFNFNTSDSNQLHLFLSIQEITPGEFFSFMNHHTIEETQMKLTKTIFRLGVTLVNNQKQLLVNNSINLLVHEGETPGIGIIDNDHSLTSKGFIELLKVGFNFLLNPDEELVQAIIKVPPAFMVDNVITPMIKGKPRVYVREEKGIAAYPYFGGQQMIRMVDPVFRKLKLKGKNADTVSGNILTAIDKASNIRGSFFTFLEQDSRDVMRNRNYQLKLAAQMVEKTEEGSFTIFLPGKVHYLFEAKDTVANFTIETNKTEPGKFLLLDRNWNGYDTSSISIFAQRKLTTPFDYRYKLTGTIGRDLFTIKCSGNNAIREIFLNDKLVVIAQGKFMPQRFVVFDASLSPELLNQLFVIGFARFFD